MVTAITSAAQPRLRSEESGFRRRLLDGLAQAIREKGLAESQISDIVANARTSNRTFYECFADKEACFEELIEEWSLEIVGSVRAALDPEAPWDRQVDSTVDAFLAAFSADPALAVTISRELTTLGRRGVEWQERDLDRYVELLMEVSRRPRMKVDGVEPVERDTAVMLVGGIAELVDRAARDERPPESVGATMKNVIKRVIGPA